MVEQRCNRLIPNEKKVSSCILQLRSESACGKRITSVLRNIQIFHCFFFFGFPSPMKSTFDQDQAAHEVWCGSQGFIFVSFVFFLYQVCNFVCTSSEQRGRLLFFLLLTFLFDRSTFAPPFFLSPSKFSVKTDSFFFFFDKRAGGLLELHGEITNPEFVQEFVAFSPLHCGIMPAFLIKSICSIFQKS